MPIKTIRLTYGRDPTVGQDPSMLAVIDVKQARPHYDIDGDSVRGWLTADDVIACIERGIEGARERDGQL